MAEALKQVIGQFTCPECGKSFTFTGPRKNYLFKRDLDKNHTGYFCSEHCKRSWEDKHLKSRKKKVGVNND